MWLYVSAEAISDFRLPIIPRVQLAQIPSGSSEEDRYLENSMTIVFENRR